MIWVWKVVSNIFCEIYACLSLFLPYFVFQLQHVVDCTENNRMFLNTNTYLLVTDCFLCNRLNIINRTMLNNFKYLPYYNTVVIWRQRALVKGINFHNKKKLILTFWHTFNLCIFFLDLNHKHLFWHVGNSHNNKFFVRPIVVKGF